MSKVDRIIDNEEYIIEVRAWTRIDKTNEFPRAFSKQIRIPTTSVRYEGMISMDAINNIESLLYDFHKDICDKIDDVYRSSGGKTK